MPFRWHILRPLLLTTRVGALWSSRFLKCPGHTIGRKSMAVQPQSEVSLGHACGDSQQMTHLPRLATSRPASCTFSPRVWNNVAGILKAFAHSLVQEVQTPPQICHVKHHDHPQIFIPPAHRQKIDKMQIESKQTPWPAREQLIRTATTLCLSTPLSLSLALSFSLSLSLLSLSLHLTLPNSQLEAPKPAESTMTETETQTFTPKAKSRPLPQSFSPSLAAVLNRSRHIQKLPACLRFPCG